MNSFVDLIRKIGIFMIAAQAVIHFAPGQKYEKYLKMVVSVMILLQFLTPVYEIFAKAGTDWEAKLNALEDEMSGSPGEQTNVYVGADPVSETFISTIEEEIKSKLNSGVSDENYLVENVRVIIHMTETTDETINKEYVIDKVRVVVRACVQRSAKEHMEGGEGQEELSNIEIPKITLTENAKEGQSGMESSYDKEESQADGREEIEDQLKERFCGVLGMEEEYMEVSLYGFVEDGFR